MATTALLVSVCMLFLSFVINRKISSLTVLYNLIWSVLILISIIGYDGISKPGDEVYRIFLTGSIAFNLASAVFAAAGIAIKRRDKRYRPATKGSVLRRHRTVIVIQIIMLAYYLVKLFMILRFLYDGGSYNSVRGFYFSGQFLSSTFEYVLITYFFDPMITVTQIIFAMNLFNRKYKLPVLAVMALNIIIRAVISGGRMILFEFVIISIFAYLAYYRSSTKLARGKRIQLVLMCFFITLVAVYISFGRTGENTGFIDTVTETLVINFTGSFSYFSLLLNKGLFMPGKTYGSAMFAGVSDIFISALRAFGLTETKLVQNSIGIITEKFWAIGHYSYNAMPTMYYFFMTDWGRNGIIIGSTIFALITSFAERFYNNRKTYKRFAIFILISLIVFESPMTWLPFRSSFFVAVVFAAILFDNRLLSDE